MTITILDDHVDRLGCAEILHCKPRTVAVYEREPDGLPYTKIGYRKFYHVPSIKEWLLRRQRRPNPRRKA